MGNKQNYEEGPKKDNKEKGNFIMGNKQNYEEGPKDYNKEKGKRKIKDNIIIGQIEIHMTI